MYMYVSIFQNFFDKTFLFLKKYKSEYIIAKLILHLLLESPS